MSFDPDADPRTQADHDAYVQWCARELLAAGDEGPEMTPRVYATALIAASKLWVVAQAQLHLDDAVTEHRESYQLNLAEMFIRARKVERAKGDVRTGDLLAARVALDCFMPVGRHAETLLEASKVAIEALLLVLVYPLANKWDIQCPAAWALILVGCVLLEEIKDEDDDHGPLVYADYAVAPTPAMSERIAWNAAHRTAQQMGADAPSPN